MSSTNNNEDSLDRDRINQLKREMKFSHGYNGGADHGKLILYPTPALGEKLQRMELRTRAGEQGLRTGPRNGLAHTIPHARTKHTRRPK